ncbi:UbiA family prenyltransferase [Halogeometricum limi]|uniref:UbiA prenyltransferase family protein n=1 Tax=Halogeometricum limi TaxID=555875 RepID=A0A1I6G0A9_9EURY|nr:UbiA family prenyltransferase [Halogeometricum limi]SFR35591.1 UbiA prenyltransferase family protein [Halogeometricum limi]
MSNESGSLSLRAENVQSSYRALFEVALSLFERAKDAFFYSSAYLVLVAIAEVVTVTYALSVELNAAPVVVGLVTFAVYMGDRIADVDTDELSNPDQCAFVRRHYRVLSVLSAASYGLAIALSMLGGPLALAITLLPGAFWILYASDWLPSVGAQFSRLKDVLVVNSAVVAAAWAVAVVFLPLAFADAAFTSTAAVVFAYFFVDTFVNTEIPNVGDRAADEAIGVSTLPVVFGVARTRQILHALNLALVPLLGFALLAGLVSTPVTVGILVGVAAVSVVVSFLGRTDNGRLLSVASEAKSLLVVGVVLLASTAGL